MHEVQIDIIRTQVLQAGIERLLHAFRRMSVVPELSHEEDVLARHARLLDRVPNCRLCAIDARSVDVSIAGFESSENSGFLSVLVLPGTEAECWYRCAGVELMLRTAVA